MLSLREISDRLEIQQLLIDYADAIDTNDMAKLDNIFTPDAFVSYTPYGGREGRYSELRDWLRESLSAFSATQHLVANPDIRIDGDVATGKVMCFNPLVAKSGDAPNGVMFLGLWYKDCYARTPDGWRITAREEIPSWDMNLKLP
ncbi:nuclear transport factor 2 family protein [Rhizorhabdus argentea]|uniref:nuclear transport factor 2 family protein n=1 Tax=Rhizorhabdus argentea TaxID=1387174 RepID=UPI0030EB4146